MDDAVRRRRHRFGLPLGSRMPDSDVADALNQPLDIFLAETFWVVTFLHPRIPDSTCYGQGDHRTRPDCEKGERHQKIIIQASLCIPTLSRISLVLQG